MTRFLLTRASDRSTPNRLQKRLAALYSLSESDKTVGIISHVAELREKIPNQIIVSKDKTGHSFVNIKSDFYEE